MASDSLLNELSKLLPLANERIVSNLAKFGRNPTAYIRRIIVNFVIMGIATFTLDVVALIDRGFQAVITPFVDVRFSLVTAVERAGGAIVGPVTSLTNGLAETIASQLGVGAFPILVALYVLELALVVRSLPPLFAALSDAAGSIPVLGSLLDALATFLQKYIAGGDS